MESLVIAKNIYKSYPIQGEVLKGIDFELSFGEFAAIMGPSGCGKSTLLHILGLLHRPDSGNLKILNTDVLSLNRDASTIFRRDHIGFILQTNNIFSHTTVYENIEFPLVCCGISKEQRNDKIFRALQAVRLEHKALAWGNSLSGGEQQRVAIARALVNHPQLLLADEPTGALDEHNSHALMQNFCDICDSDNVAIIMVTHDSEMAKYCDKVYSLSNGSIDKIHISQKVK